MIFYSLKFKHFIYLALIAFILNISGDCIGTDVIILDVDDQSIQISNTSVLENQPIRTFIGLISPTNSDFNTYTYHLYRENLNPDNSFFEIVEDSLFSLFSFDYENDSIFNINIIGINNGGNILQKFFIIKVIDVFEEINNIPEDIILSNSFAFESAPVSTLIGIFTTTDIDTLDIHTYTLVSGNGDSDNGLFSITNDSLLLAGALDYDNDSTLEIRIQADDGNNATFTKTFIIRVIKVNPPTAITLSDSQVVENDPIGTLIGTFATADIDASDTHTYTLVSGSGDSGNGFFSTTNDSLLLSGALDYDNDSTLAIRVQTDDGKGGTFQMSFTISVNDVNNPPTAIALSDLQVDENDTLKTLIGTFSTTDIDDPDTHTYSLVSGSGDSDNGLFSIINDSLLLAGALDYDNDSTLEIRVQTDDGNGETFQMRFTISVNDINYLPTALTLSTSQVVENISIGTLIGTFTTTDIDASDIHTYTLVSGSGDSDNGLFSITNNSLFLAGALDYDNDSTLEIRVQTDDGNGGTFQMSFTISVSDVNNPPIALALSASQVAENDPVGTLIGTFTTTDIDDPDIHTYSLVSGSGDSDNGLVSITNNSLFLAGALDYDNDSTLEIRVQTDDGNGETFQMSFTIKVSDVNYLPTALTLSTSQVAENVPIGTLIGTFTTTDIDASDIHTYTLVSGSGDSNNGFFSITNNSLLLASALDYDNNSTLEIRVQTDDGNGGTFQMSFTISVSDVNNPPIALALSASQVAENDPVGTLIGTFTTTDIDDPDIHTYSLVSGSGDSDNGLVSITNNSLFLAGALDYDNDSTLEIRVQTDDGNGETFQMSFTIKVSDVNYLPTALTLSTSQVAENVPIGTLIGTFTTTDIDASDIHTYTLVSGSGDSNNGFFSITNNSLLLASALDYDNNSTLEIRVQTDDGNGGTFQMSFTISVSDVNNPPIALALSASQVAENDPVGTLIGTFTTTDIDDPDIHTYSLVSGSGDSDNGLFSITNNSLFLAGALDYDNDSTLEIRVQTDDGNGETFQMSFTIKVSDVNYLPTALTLSTSQVAENVPIGTLIGTFTTTDIDASDIHTYTLVSGSGDSNNGFFSITNNSLLLASALDYDNNSTLEIRVQTDDGNGGTFQMSFTISVSDVNNPPIALALSASQVAENDPVGTLIGTFTTTDIDDPDIHTYSLVSGSGDSDNGLFSITNNSLFLAGALNYDNDSTLSIRVQTDDGNGETFQMSFTIKVSDVNYLPTALTLSISEVDEDISIGRYIGTFSTTDIDASDIHTYTLVSGSGDSNNGFFSIRDSSLLLLTPLDYDENSEIEIRVQTDDGNGGTFQMFFTISVNDVNNPPTAIALSTLQVAENDPVGTLIGTFSTTDRDNPGDSHIYSFANGPGSIDNNSFTINGNQLLSSAVFNYENKNSYSILVLTTDSKGFFEGEIFIIEILDINEPPTNITLSNNSIDENLLVNTLVGNLTTSDSDANDTYTYSLVSGTGSTDNSSFTINGTALLTNTVFDYETKNSYSIRIRTTDSEGLTYDKVFIIGIVNLSEAPTDIILSNNTISENLFSNTQIGNLSTIDSDIGDTHTYSLVNGIGSTDNSSFTINGTALLSNTSFDYDTKNSYSIRIQSIDDNGGSYEKSFMISITEEVIDIETINIESGSFEMGCKEGRDNGGYPCQEYELPLHTVTLFSFQMSKYEITNAQYATFLNELGGVSADGSYNDPDYGNVNYARVGSQHCMIYYEGGTFYVLNGLDNYPMIGVSWYGARAFAASVGGRLPTEAEWEFAARGGNESQGHAYSGGVSYQVGWYSSNSSRDGSSNFNLVRTHPVGDLLPNELGLYDMSGNVAEWCEDGRRTYSSDAEINPIGPSPATEVPLPGGFSYLGAVARGGHWSESSFYMRLATRNLGGLGGDDRTGFRVVF